MFDSQANQKTTFPPQRISDRLKTPKWAEACVRSIAESDFANNEGRLSLAELWRNRDIMGHKLDFRELSQIVDPRNTGLNYQDAPARLRKHNLIRPRVADVVSQASKRYYRPYAKPLAGGAFERVKEQINAAAMAYANYQLLARLAAQGAQVPLPQEAPPNPQAAAQQILQNYKDVSEIDGNKLLAILQETYRTSDVFLDTWAASCSSGEELAMVDECRGVPVFKAVDSAQFSCHMSSGTKHVDEASVQKIEEWLTLPDIIDEFGDDLSAADLRLLEEEESGGMSYGNNLRWGSMMRGGPGDGRTHYAPQSLSQLTPESPLMGRPVQFDDDPRIDHGTSPRAPQIAGQHPNAPAQAPGQPPMQNMLNAWDDDSEKTNWFLYKVNHGIANGFRGGTHRVVRTWWKSLRAYKMMYWVNPSTGNLEKSLVSDTYKLTPEDEAAGAILRKEYITENWQGTMIGSKLFKRMRPMKWQNGRLGVVGNVHRGIGEEPVPLVSVLRPLMLQWIGLFFQIDREANKAQGKKIVVYVDDLPSFDPNNPQKSFDHFESKIQNDDILYLQRHKQGGYAIAQANSPNIPVQSIDLTASQLITQLLSVCDRIERVMAMVSGVPNERMAVLAPSAPAASNDMAMSQSTFMLDPLLNVHDSFRNRALETLLHCGIACFDNNSWGQLVLTDQTREWTMIDPANLNDTLLGVGITTEPKKAQLLDRLQESVLRRWESGAMDVLTMVKACNVDSLADLERVLAEAESLLQQSQAASQQAAAAKAEADRQDALQVEYAKINAGLQEALITAGVAMSAESDKGITPFEQATLDLKEADSARKSDENNRRIDQQQTTEASKERERNLNLMATTAKLIEQNKARLLQQKELDQAAEQFEREQDQQDKEHADHVRLQEKKLAIDKQKADKPVASAKK